MLLSECHKLLTGIAQRTGTMVIVDQIETSAAVLALTERTVVQIFTARLAAPALMALALKAAGRIVAGVRIDAGSQAPGTVAVIVIVTAVIIRIVDAFVEV